MQEKPYFCPNCRSNRVKFKVISRSAKPIVKDALTGAVVESDEPKAIEDDDPMIQCTICHYIGNEMRFIKQAEREPRVAAATSYTYH